MRIDEFNESQQLCPECGGPSFSNLLLAEKQDACYAKVKSRYKVWPSAYASGALVQCRKKGAANWGNKSKNESVAEGDMYGDQEVSWEKGGRRAPTGAFRNPAAKKPYNDPDWTRNLPKEKLDALAGPRYKKDKKPGVAEGRDMCNVCGQTPCNCTHISEDMDMDTVYVIYVDGKPKVRFKDVQQAIDTYADLKKHFVNKQVVMKKAQHPAHSFTEEYNAEYNDEAGMADNNLETLERAVEGIDELIDAGDNLPEWCQEKIAVAKSMLVTVWDYMKSEEDRGAVPELNEEFDLIESIINQIAGQNGVDPEMVWEDLESLTEDELYAFAVTSQLNEDWQKANKSDRTDGMSRKAVKAYRRAHPGSKLQTAVTTKPSKLKRGSKASKRRKSYCSRSRGQMKMHNISCAKTPDKAICKARRRWNC